MTTPTLILRDAKPEKFWIRWQFEAASELLTVQTTTTGTVVDVQRLGAVDYEWAPSGELVHALSARVAEELARVRLIDALSESQRRDRRWAA